MELPYTNLTLTDIGNTLGTSDRTLKGLCTHPNINIFSWHKPFAHPSNVVDINDIEAIRGSNHGFKYTPILSAPELGGELPEIYYQPPTGGTNEPFRIGDFRGYKHDAPPCISLNIEHSYTSTTSSIFKLTFNQDNNNLPLSSIVNTMQFRIALVYKNANRIKVKTHPILVKDMNPHETYSIEMQGMLLDEGLLTDFYVCMITKDFPEEKDAKWSEFGTVIGLNWKSYKEYHKQYTIIGVPKETITFDMELRLTNHINRYWICKPIIYFSPIIFNNTVTFNASDYYLRFYSENRFKDTSGKTFYEILVDINGSWSTNSSERVFFDDVMFPFEETDLSLYPKGPVYMYLHRRAKDGAKDKIVLQKEIDFHNVR